MSNVLRLRGGLILDNTDLRILRAIRQMSAEQMTQADIAMVAKVGGVSAAGVSLAKLQQHGYIANRGKGWGLSRPDWPKDYAEAMVRCDRQPILSDDDLIKASAIKTEGFIDFNFARSRWEVTPLGRSWLRYCGFDEHAEKIGAIEIKQTATSTSHKAWGTW